MILLERYELLKAIGDHAISVGFGSYGQVKLAKDLKTGKHVAVKIVNDSSYTRYINWRKTKWSSTNNYITPTLSSC